AISINQNPAPLRRRSKRRFRRSASRLLKERFSCIRVLTPPELSSSLHELSLRILTSVRHKSDERLLRRLPSEGARRTGSFRAKSCDWLGPSSSDSGPGVARWTNAVCEFDIRIWQDSRL